MPDSAPPPPLVFLVAGESSGDNLGGRLMRALAARTGGRVRFAGIGGRTMAEQGLDSLFPMRELALVGLAEILPHLPRLMRRMGETVAAIDRLRPDAIVTIDSPGFNFRLARRIRPLGIPVIHYVAPQLWAWRAERGRKLAGTVDHLMALLPFEPEFFRQFSVPCTYVGHPLLEFGIDRGDAERFRTRHGIAADRPVVVVMAGSRRGEIRRLLPVFGAALARLRQQVPGLAVVLPTVEATLPAVEAAVAAWPERPVIVTDTAEKYDAYAAATAALTKSGTSTLELTIAGVPMVVAYRVNALTAMLLRRLMQIDTVAMVNLLAGRRVVPELLQENCTPDRLAAELGTLLADPAARAAQRAGYAEALARLRTNGAPPSDRAADVVLAAIGGAGPKPV